MSDIEKSMNEIIANKRATYGDVFQTPCAPQILAVLYCGLSTPAGIVIPYSDFESFLLEEVTPQYPGFTVTYARGFWKGKPEEMASISILMEDDSNARHGVRMLAEKYKSRFGQEAVGIAFMPCQFTLYTWPSGPVELYHKPGLGY